MKDKQVNSKKYLRIGKDGDAGAVQSDDILDLQAPIYQPVQLTHPNELTLIPFSEHKEKVTRQMWLDLVRKTLQQVTQPDMAIRSIVLDEQQRLMIAFVQPKTSYFNTLIVSTTSQAEMLWTGYFSGAKRILQYIRHYVSNQVYDDFTFGMYGYLRLIADTDNDLQLHSSKGKYFLNDAGISITPQEAGLIKHLCQHQLIKSTEKGFQLTPLGLSMLNYFARFYESDWQITLTDGFMKREIKNSLKPKAEEKTSRKRLKLPREVLLDD